MLSSFEINSTWFNILLYNIHTALFVAFCGAYDPLQFHPHKLPEFIIMFYFLKMLIYAIHFFLNYKKKNSKII